MSGHNFTHHGRMGQRFADGVNVFVHHGPTFLQRWLAALALALVILSWWQDRPVPQVIRGVVQSTGAAWDRLEAKVAVQPNSRRVAEPQAREPSK